MLHLLTPETWTPILGSIAHQNAFIHAFEASKQGREVEARNAAAEVLRAAFHASPEVAEARRLNYCSKFNEVAGRMSNEYAPTTIEELDRLLGVMGFRLKLGFERISE